MLVNRDLTKEEIKRDPGNSSAWQNTRRLIL
jgi:hypothetical protein